MAFQKLAEGTWNIWSPQSCSSKGNGKIIMGWYQKAQLFLGQIDTETLFGGLLFASFMGRLVYSGCVPLTGDEALHWQWSRHLDWGYPEHPPLIAWAIAASTALFGDTEWAVRLPSIVAMTAAHWALFRFSSEMFGPRTALFGVLPVMIAPIYNVLGTLAYTDALYFSFLCLSLLYFKRAALDSQRSAWFVLGLAVGLCRLSKLTALFLFPVGALFLASDAWLRRWFYRWEPYVAVLLSLIVMIPSMNWNIHHQWITFSFRFGHQLNINRNLVYFLEHIGSQFVVLSPFLYLWALWGLYWAWQRRNDVNIRLLLIFSIIHIAFFLGYSLIARTGIHWPFAGYVGGFLVAAIALRENAPKTRCFYGWAVSMALIITILIYAVPLRPEVMFFRWSYPFRSDRITTDRFNLIFDWRILGKAVQAQLDVHKGRTFVLCRRYYGLASLVAFYTPSHPSVHLWDRPNRNGLSYSHWRDEMNLRGWNAVVVEDRLKEDWLQSIRPKFKTFQMLEPLFIWRNNRVLKTFYLYSGEDFQGFPDDRTTYS